MIGSIVDFIDDNVRWRGIVLDQRNNECLIGVVGGGVCSQPRQRLSVVKDSNSLINLLRD